MRLSDYLGYRIGKGYACPFCSSSDALFMVPPHKLRRSQYDSGAFKCFSCDTGGDGIKYVRLVESKTFTEALEALGLTMALVDTDEQLEQAAIERARQREREEKGLHLSETMQMCLDIVEIRNGLLHRSHLIDWLRHGYSGLPVFLRHTPASQRQEERMEAERKSGARAQRLEAWRQDREAQALAIDRTEALMLGYIDTHITNKYPRRREVHS